jgi:hypothetical protein
LVVHSVQGVDSLRSASKVDDWRHERVTKTITIRESSRDIKRTQDMQRGQKSVKSARDVMDKT